MPRQSLTLVVLFAISFMGFMGYSYLSRPESVAAVQSPMAAAVPASTQHVETGTEQVVPADSETSSLPTLTSDSVVKLIADAIDDDPKTRAAAIAALAMAPRSQALPVLQKVLNTGEPTVDRPLALSSLRTLALQQGDADGGIRDVLRQAIYHGDDAATTGAAQTTLDDVEGHLSQGLSNTHP